MKVVAKTPALLLIAALMLATGVWTGADHTGAPGAASAPLTTPGRQHAGCHGHGGGGLPESSRSTSPLPHSPLQAPVSYRCCLTGHAAALPQTSDLQQLSIHYASAREQIEFARTEHLLNAHEVPTVLSADPPNTAPLRI
jgi:hypothetical protein